MNLRKQSGFTLLEIMIVVAVIGILATLATPNLIDYSKRTVAKQQLQVIAANLAALRVREDGANGLVPLFVVSGSACAMCEGGLTGGNPKAGLTSARYLQIWQNLGYDKVPIDPWGNPVVLDENDEESPGCGMDTLWSAGQDGIFSFTDGSTVNGDDIVVRIPVIRRRCGEDPRTGGYPL